MEVDWAARIGDRKGENERKDATGQPILGAKRKREQYRTGQEEGKKGRRRRELGFRSGPQCWTEAPSFCF